MPNSSNSLWQDYQYKVSGFLLILPFYFLYQSLFPEFPDAWEAKKIGSFQVIPMPYNLDPPYLHDGVYTKDFFFTFKQGDIKNIRQAYVNIGKHALPLHQLALGNAGILHGSQHGQEAHAISPAVLNSEDEMWLTIENWDGKSWVTSWPIATSLLDE
jgi:hypothetical protein